MTEINSIHVKIFTGKAAKLLIVVEVIGGLKFSENGKQIQAENQFLTGLSACFLSCMVNLVELAG